MNRRDTVLALLALGITPLAAKAQQPPKLVRIAYLGIANPEGAGNLLDAFKQGMRELGYIEGKNVVFEVRWALGMAERLPELAKELVALNPDVIIAPGTGQATAARKATAVIPIVAINVSDPVGSGFAISLARPGGNITGLSFLAADVSSKLLELLLAVVPKLSRVAVLWNSSSLAPKSYLQNLQSAAQLAKVNILTLEAQTPAEISIAFARIVREKIGGVIVPVDGLYIIQRRQIAEVTIRNRIPTVFANREDVEAGGLVSYGQSYVEGFRRSATYVDKILKGAKPSDLPFEQSTAFELAINLKTAKLLGLTVPKELLLRADRVIE